MPLVNRRDDLFDRYRSKFALAFPGKSSDVLHCLLGALAAALGIGHNARNGPAIAEDDDRRAAFDLVEQLRKMRLRHRGLHLAHIFPSFCIAMRKDGGGILTEP